MSEPILVLISYDEEEEHLTIELAEGVTISDALMAVDAAREQLAWQNRVRQREAWRKLQEALARGTRVE